MPFRRGTLSGKGHIRCMSEPRPPHFPPGTAIGEHYTVEGIVRLAEGRMFYLANDHRPDKATRKCWECGHADTARSEQRCASCGAASRDRRYLVSSRWVTAEFEAYEAFFALGLKHPGLASPIDVFRVNDQLLSVIPYENEGLMLDEPSPLSNQRTLDIGQRLAGVLAFLRRHGVRLRHVTRANLLVWPDNTVRLFDLDVAEVREGAVAEGDELVSVAQLLRRYCDVESDELALFLAAAEAGDHANPAAFGRAVEERFDRFGDVTYRPLLGANSDVGLSRQLNEDNWGWRKLASGANLYVVADGMGGHDSGEVASEIAVQTICKVAVERAGVLSTNLDSVENLLDEAFQAANNTIKDEAEARGTDMGTTLVSVLVLENRVMFLANVGDSRAYLLRNQSLHQLSRDHSLVAKMVERGRITAEEARNHPHSNILLRTVGTDRDIEIDMFRFELESGDRVLLCTDGLWGEVEDRVMEAILNRYTDPRVASRELIRAAHHGGGKDNITLLVVSVP